MLTQRAPAATLDARVAELVVAVGVFLNELAHGGTVGGQTAKGAVLLSQLQPHVRRLVGPVRTGAPNIGGVRESARLKSTKKGPPLSTL